MKILTTLFLVIFLGKGCGEANKLALENTIIEYTANTRGYYYQITVQNQMVSVSKDRSGKESPVVTKLSDSDWNEIITDFKAINLEDIPKLEAPTKYRHHDGAAMANLQIRYHEKVYKSQTFDNGYPPEPIAKLVNKINSFAKRE